MAQHFLLSSKAKTLNLASVFRMTDAEAEASFRKIRWSMNDGKPVCPECGSVEAYECRRPNGALRFRCKGCKVDFTITSGTLFASHKLPIRTYLAAIAVFCNEVKGKSMLAMSRDLGLSYKAAFVLCHKMREAMAEEMKGRVIGGEGKIAETDGAYFGGYVKPANLKSDRIDRRLSENQSGKRQVVVIVRERNGNSLPAVFKSEGAALGWIKARVAKGTTLNADEANSWNDLHSRFEMKRINHQEAYSLNGACTNWAESYFSRLRRAEAGHHHHIAGAYSMTPDIRIAVTGQNPTEISGVTNLPDGTVFAISLIGEAPHCSPTCWIQYPSAVVRNAKFETHLDTSYAPAMPAAYAVDVVTVDPSLEPPAFRNVTGLGGRHLHGPFVAVIDASGHYQSVDFGADPSNVSGRFIHYTQRIVMIPDGEVVKAACLGQENADPSSAGAFGIECGPAQ